MTREMSKVGLRDIFWRSFQGARDDLLRLANETAERLVIALRPPSEGPCRQSLRQIIENQDPALERG